jgi:hypothetical protein
MTLGDFRQYVRRLKGKLVGHEGAVVRGIHSGCMRAIGVIQFSVDHAFPASPRGASGAVDTGGYKRRWQFELLPSGGRVFNDHPAADVIEKGRRPNRKRPPIQAIKIWAQRRLGLSSAEADKAKYPIAMAIAKRGLTGRRVLTNPATTDKITRIVMEEIMSEVRAALRRGGY